MPDSIDTVKCFLHTPNGFELAFIGATDNCIAIFIPSNTTKCIEDGTIHVMQNLNDPEMPLYSACDVKIVYILFLTKAYEFFKNGSGCLTKLYITKPGAEPTELTLHFSEAFCFAHFINSITVHCCPNGKIYWDYRNYVEIFLKHYFYTDKKLSAQQSEILAQKISSVKNNTFGTDVFLFSEGYHLNVETYNHYANLDIDALRERKQHFVNYKINNFLNNLKHLTTDQLLILYFQEETQTLLRLFTKADETLP